MQRSGTTAGRLASIRHTAPQSHFQGAATALWRTRTGACALSRRLRLVTWIADGLQVGFVIRAAFGLRPDVIDLCCACHTTYAQARLAQAAVPFEYQLAQPGPRCAVATGVATTASRVADPASTLMRVVGTEARFGDNSSAAEVPTGCRRFTRHCGRADANVPWRRVRGYAVPSCCE